MTESKAREAALKLVNEIALVDLDLAAKIKPSIDMFVESIGSSLLSNSELFTALTDFFKLTSKSEKEKWLDSHENIKDQVYKTYDLIKTNNESMNINEEKELKPGVNVDVPIEPDGQKKKTKKDDEEDAEQDAASMPVPEDKFDGETITAPLKIDGDDQCFMGKDKKPTEKELDPNNTPKVINATADTSATIQLPDLTKMKTAMEAVKRIHKQSLLENMKKTISNFKLVKEGKEDVYTEFLDQMALDIATTTRENDPKGRIHFVPIRRYATALYKKFNDDFESYDEALQIARTWYEYNGRKKYRAIKGVPSDVYVEMRGNVKGFKVNVFLVKPVEEDEYEPELTTTDTEMAADVNETFTGEYSDDDVDLFEEVGTTESGNSKVWKMEMEFPKERKLDFPVSRLKHEICNFIRKEYKDKYNPSTKMPSWIYDIGSNTEETDNEELDESVGEFDKNEVQELAQEFIEDVISVGGNPFDQTAKDFMDWAWDGNVPEKDKAYVAKMFNYERNIMFNESMNSKPIGESLSRDIESILFSVFQEIFDEYVDTEAPDDEVDWDDANYYIKEKFINDFEDYDIPDDVAIDIANLDIEDIENYVDEFLNDTRKRLEMGIDPE